MTTEHANWCTCVLHQVVQAQSYTGLFQSCRCSKCAVGWCAHLIYYFLDMNSLHYVTPPVDQSLSRKEEGVQVPSNQRSCNGGACWHHTLAWPIRRHNEGEGAAAAEDQVRPSYNPCSDPQIKLRIRGHSQKHLSVCARCLYRLVLTTTFPLLSDTETQCEMMQEIVDLILEVSCLSCFTTAYKQRKQMCHHFLPLYRSDGRNGPWHVNTVGLLWKLANTSCLEG